MDWVGLCRAALQISVIHALNTCVWPGYFWHKNCSMMLHSTWFRHEDKWPHQCSTVATGRHVWTSPVTSLAAVGGLEVGCEVAWTRPRGEQVVVGDADTAATSSRALGVQQAAHVDVAAEVAVVARHAPADWHPAVARSIDHDHLVGLSTAGVELLHQAVVARLDHACMQSQSSKWSIAVCNQSHRYLLQAPTRHMASYHTQCYLPPCRGDILTFTPAEIWTNHQFVIRRKFPSAV